MSLSFPGKGFLNTSGEGPDAQRQAEMTFSTPKLCLTSALPSYLEVSQCSTERSTKLL